MQFLMKKQGLKKAVFVVIGSLSDEKKKLLDNTLVNNQKAEAKILFAEEMEDFDTFTTEEEGIVYVVQSQTSIHLFEEYHEMMIESDVPILGYVFLG